MRVVHLSTHDRRGGAAIAAYRQHEALRRAGVESRMWVGCKDTADPFVAQYSPSPAIRGRVARVLRRYALRASRNWYAAEAIFSDDRSAHGGDECAAMPAADVVNLHWAAGFVDQPALYRHLPARIPVVCTMHDMNPFTGGCHYSGECTRFTSACGSCPCLGRPSGSDYSASVWRRKRASYLSRPQHKLCFVADSHWLASQAKRSSLLAGQRVEVIHYGLDLAVFKPLDQTLARTALGIEHQGPIAAFTAADLNNERKGIRYLIGALRAMSSRPFLLCWGKRFPAGLADFPHLHLGELASEPLMALAYSAADICVAPSLEEAFGQTALESIACGRPVVAFKTGGLVDTVRHGQTGLLVEGRDTQGLREAIERLLADAALRFELGAQGRRLAEEAFSYHTNAGKYLALYEDMLSAR